MTDLFRFFSFFLGQFYANKCFLAQASVSSRFFKCGILSCFWSYFFISWWYLLFNFDVVYLCLLSVFPFFEGPSVYFVRAFTAQALHFVPFLCLVSLSLISAFIFFPGIFFGFILLFFLVSKVDSVVRLFLNRSCFHMNAAGGTCFPLRTTPCIPQVDMRPLSLSVPYKCFVISVRPLLTQPKQFLILQCSFLENEAPIHAWVCCGPLDSVIYKKRCIFGLYSWHRTP